MKPDASLYNPSREYLLDLIERSGHSQRSAAKQIGVSERSMRDYLNPVHKSKAPYPVQYCLECLASGEGVS